MTINKMLSRLLVVSALTFLALPAFAGRGKPSASADCADLVYSECITYLTTLCDDTSDAGSLKTRDQNGLIGKVLNANVKLTQDKVSDASKKLDDYDTKLNALNDARKPKISDEDFVKLLGDVLDAQMCVGGL
jgi:hypothetical protein